MTHQTHGHYTRVPIDAGGQIAQLRQVLVLVSELAGRSSAPSESDTSLAEIAQVASVYGNALTIVQRRFDALAAETASWSAAAIEALLHAGEQRSTAAARRLADELNSTLRDLLKLLPL